MKKSDDIYFVSGNATHLKAVCDLLKSMYVVLPFDDSNELGRAFKITTPKAVIIDEYFPSGGGGLKLLDYMKQTEHLRLVPVVFLANSGSSRQIEGTRYRSYVKTVLKPYRSSELINALSSLLNAGIETAWNSLGEIQKAALTNTLESFNSIADMIAEGKPVEFQEMKESCAYLSDAIEQGSFKEILKGVKGHDNYTYVHSLRVAVFLSLFGDHIGMNKDEVNLLASGGLLHDVGKMYIPHDVLNKPGRLDDQEMTVMRSHVNHSIDFLDQSLDIPKGVKIIAAQHHEKLDGSGYPFGIEGKKLSELARMSAIVDIFSALTDRRVYKPPMSPEKAISIMEEMEGHIDMHFLKSFKELLLDATSDDEENETY